MQGLSNVLETNENDFSFNQLFTPLSTKKAIAWIIVIGLLVFANSLFNGFVWDDKSYVLANSQQLGLDLPKLLGSNLFNATGYYRPLPAIYFAVLYSLFGQIPFFYHLLQIGLHIGNAILVFLLFKSFFRKYIAFFLSLIFLVHPMQTEAVIYIAQTESISFFLLGMTALLLNRAKQTTSRLWITTCFLFLIALLTKEAAIIFILMVVLYRFIFAKGNVRAYTLLGALSVGLYALIRLGIFQITLYHKGFIPIQTASATDRLLNTPAITWYYLKTFFFPLHLIVDQQWVVKTFTLQTFYLPLLFDCSFFFLIVLLGIVLFRQKSKLFQPYLFFTIWFVVGIGILEQVVPLDMTVADRWFYFPMAGLLGVIGVILEYFLQKNPQVKNLTYTFLIIIIVLLSLRTIVRNTDWQSPFTLYSHDEKLTNSYSLEGNLGYEYYISGDLTRALVHYKKSAALLPYDKSISNVGTIYEFEGKYKLAAAYYLKALNAVDPDPPYHHSLILYIRLARVLFYHGRPEDAYRYINIGLQTYPHDYGLLTLKGMTEIRLHQKTKALATFREAYFYAPTDSKAFIQQLIENPTKELPESDFH